LPSCSFKLSILIFDSSDIRDSVTVRYSPSPGWGLISKMLRQVELKLHVVLLDCSLNSADTVRQNVVDSAAIAGLRLVAYATALDQPPCANASLLVRSALALADATAHAILRRTATSVSLAAGCQHHFREAELRELVLASVAHAFRRKESQFGEAASVIARLTATRVQPSPFFYDILLY